MQIRNLDPQTDRAMVDAFFLACADYVRLERDADPGPEVTEEFFAEAPPGCDPAHSLRLGLFDCDLIGIAELAFGYPAAADAYIGLMMIAPSARRTGAGTFLLRHLEGAARARGMQALFLGVLDANPRGRAFWKREGFNLTSFSGPITLGAKTQLAHRMGKSL
jgi:GNAT superfamily N-acetyltransferase